MSLDASLSLPYATRSWDYIKFLSGDFELKAERDYTNIFGVDSDSNEMFFNKLNLK